MLDKKEMKKWKKMVRKCSYVIKIGDLIHIFNKMKENDIKIGIMTLKSDFLDLYLTNKNYTEKIDDLEITMMPIIGIVRISTNTEKKNIILTLMDKVELFNPLVERLNLLKDEAFFRWVGIVLDQEISLCQKDEIMKIVCEHAIISLDFSQFGKKKERINFLEV